MQPSNDILDALVDLLATDPATLAPAANALHVHLVAAAFTPSVTLAFADVTPATFTGSTPADAGLGACQVFVDPVTGNRQIQLNEPAGGWTWACTADPVTPETIFGYIVTDNTDAVVIGSARINPTQTISAAGQAIVLPWIRFNFLSTSPN